MQRRGFVKNLAAGAGAAFAGCGTGPGPADSSVGAAGPSVEELEAAAARPVLVTSGLDSPVILDSLRLLRKGDEYFIHVRSKDGAEGISVTNSRASYLYPILHDCIRPFLLGKDMRDLENVEWELYRHGSNYKLQGLAFWCPHAWVEFAIIDMLGRIAGKSMPEMLGGAVRQTVPYYVASGRRDSTPTAACAASATPCACTCRSS